MGSRKRELASLCQTGSRDWVDEMASTEIEIGGGSGRLCGQVSSLLQRVSHGACGTETRVWVRGVGGTSAYVRTNLNIRHYCRDDDIGGQAVVAAPDSATAKETRDNKARPDVLADTSRAEGGRRQKQMSAGQSGRGNG